MNINMEFNEKLLSLSFENICLILGENNQGKTYLLNEIESGLNGTIKTDFEVNGLKIYKGDYNVIKINDLDTFSSEFKFSKSNIFRKLIYNDIIDNIDETTENKYLNKFNDIFIDINNKVNEYLNSNLYNNQLKIKTELDSVDKIIEKFTNIYIEDKMFNEKYISKGKGRELLYKLTLNLINSKIENQVLLIDGIDNYLAGESLTQFINQLINIAENNVKIIITGNSPLLYQYFFNRAAIYKIKNFKLKKIRSFADLLIKTILMTEHSKDPFNIPFNSYAEQNIELIKEDDIKHLFNKYVYPNLLNIGLLLCVNKIKLINECSNNIENSIFYRDIIEYNLYLSICEELGIDN